MRIRRSLTASPQQQEAQGVAVTGVPKLPLGLQRVQAMRGHSCALPWESPSSQRSNHWLVSGLVSDLRDIRPQ